MTINGGSKKNSQSKPGVQTETSPPNTTSTPRNITVSHTKRKTAAPEFTRGTPTELVIETNKAQVETIVLCVTCLNHENMEEVSQDLENSLRSPIQARR